MTVVSMLPPWMRAAACQGLADASCDPWHEPAYYTAAKRVCNSCPVRADCLEWATSVLLPLGIAQGVYGGLEPVELRHHARRLGAPARKVPQHGTRARYVAGCHCPQCRWANSAYEHQRRARTPTHEVVLVLAHPAGRGRRRAFPGQYMLFADISA